MFKIFFPLFFISFYASQNLGASFQGAVTAGSGQGGRAVLEETDGSGLNPAMISFIRGYHVRVTGSQSPSLGGLNSRYQISLLDNTPETPFPASILYSETNQSGYEEKKEKDFLFSLGHLYHPRFSLGFGIGYRSEQLLDENQNRISPSTIYGVFGMQYFFRPELSFAMSMDDKQGGIGVGYIMKNLLRLRGDISKTNKVDEGLGYHVGAEAFLSRWLVLRGGHEWFHQSYESGDKGAGSWGLGFVGPRLKLNYAYAPVVGPKLGYAHWLDLSLPLW